MIQIHLQTQNYKEFYRIIKVLIKDYQLYTLKKSKPGTYGEIFIITSRSSFEH